MTAPGLVHPPVPTDTDSIDETASHLEGELGLDGTASLRTETPAEPSTLHNHLQAPSSNRLSRASTSSDSSEGYDSIQIDPTTIIEGGVGGGVEPGEACLSPPRRHSITPRQPSQHTSRFESIKPPSLDTKRPEFQRRRSIPIKLEKTDKKGRYLLIADDAELRDILKQGIERGENGNIKKRRSRFGDLVFTRQFTAFDRQNPSGVGSAFHGFYTLFWLGTAVMLVKIMANNWRDTGSILGTSEMLKVMFHRDVAVMLATDGVMCAGTVWLADSKSLANIISGIIMLMKMHSYAFYNGHLSEVLKRRRVLEKKLHQLDELDQETIPTTLTPSVSAFATSYLEAKDLHHQLNHRRRHSAHASTPTDRNVASELANVASALDSEAPLDADQIRSLRRLLRWEIDTLNEELRGKSTESENIYPLNLTLRDFYAYIPLPTVVYELEYPRQAEINWEYVVEKTIAVFGVIGVMMAISQAYIYPVVMQTVHMRDQEMPLVDRLKEFPWILLDLIGPFMMEYLLSWYVIWELILNLLAEVTRFADRGFYADWWNCTSWDAFARDWNRPVHNFLLRHVYHSSISSFHVSRNTATLITFLLSAFVHELVMWCIFKRLRGYLLFFQMIQLPLIQLSRSKWMKGRTVLGNIAFWIGILTGPSLLCSLYLII
ncbi:MAG: acyl-CoA/sterol acyltransferase [Cirrosporium novae-zelandiae]|nr:MAG: acyl-CoA/sterol acyltransferase [Cirrosporium novae-zelandiae]